MQKRKERGKGRGRRIKDIDNFKTLCPGYYLSLKLINFIFWHSLIDILSGQGSEPQNYNIILSMKIALLSIVQC